MKCSKDRGGKDEEFWERIKEWDMVDLENLTRVKRLGEVERKNVEKIQVKYTGSKEGE